MPKTNKNPSEAVEKILRERNVGLKKYIASHLVPFAAELREHCLIEGDIENNMRTIGKDSFTLASELMSACHPSLTSYPKETFPEFIAVMKKFADMRRLAKEMEDDYTQKSMSRSTFSISCIGVFLLFCNHPRRNARVSAFKGRDLCAFRP